jgi:hypothetical protein
MGTKTAQIANAPPKRRRKLILLSFHQSFLIAMGKRKSIPVAPDIACHRSLAMSALSVTIPLGGISIGWVIGPPGFSNMV